MAFTRPVPFKGTETQRQANRRSHQFVGIDGRCFRCDHKSWHVGADYPCMAEVPRESVEIDNPGTTDLHPGLGR